LSATRIEDLERRNALRRRGRRLEWFTLASCAVEAGVGLVAGGLARSIALLGFGLQSLIEVTSGGIMLWRLAPVGAPGAGTGRKDERLALRLIGITLFLVAAYIAYGAGKTLLLREHPQASPAGVALAVASLVTMPLLARAKRRVAAQLHSAALKADAVHTDVCTWQAAIMLVGLGFNMALGWWWADPAAALCMVPLVARAGLQAIRGEACGCVTCDTE
jgi:divalent metal cation (Fe/Co/Zn/Cd) transporter